MSFSFFFFSVRDILGKHYVRARTQIAHRSLSRFFCTFWCICSSTAITFITEMIFHTDESMTFVKDEISGHKNSTIYLRESRTNQRGGVYTNEIILYGIKPQFCCHSILRAIIHKGLIWSSLKKKKNNNLGACSSRILRLWILGHFDGFGMLLEETWGVTPFTPSCCCMHVYVYCMCISGWEFWLGVILNAVKWSLFLVICFLRKLTALKFLKNI